MSRDVEAIDAELHLLAAVRTAVRDDGGQPTTGPADELLDERLDAADRGGPVQD